MPEAGHFDAFQRLAAISEDLQEFLHLVHERR
jgi:hypothetical protein